MDRAHELLEALDAALTKLVHNRLVDWDQASNGIDAGLNNHSFDRLCSSSLAPRYWFGLCSRVHATASNEIAKDCVP